MMTYSDMAVFSIPISQAVRVYMASRPPAVAESQVICMVQAAAAGEPIRHAECSPVVFEAGR